MAEETCISKSTVHRWFQWITPVSDKGAGERPHGLVRRCGKAVERVLL